MKISICLIATKRYKELVQPLVDSIIKHFLLNNEINIHLFTDELKQYNGNDRVDIFQHIIPSYGFPSATMYRYKFITSIPIELYDNYILYLDVDMKIVGDIGDEILENLVSVFHPGYYNGGGSWETNPLSTSYVHPKDRKHYYAGGVQGGRSIIYYSYAILMSKWIDEDISNGIIPCWQDESIWNKLLSNMVDFTTLNPDYCMPEPINKRIAWGINHFEPKILALEKPKGFRE